MDRVLGADADLVHYRPASYLLPALEDDVLPAYVHTQKERLLHHLLGQPADEFLMRREEALGHQLELMLEDLVVGI